MEDAPSIGEVLSHWSLDLPWWLGLVAAGVLYAVAWRRSRHTGRQAHPTWKLAVFEAGLALVAVVALSPIEHYGNQFLWVNFLDFLILTMIAAPLLVASSPLTLAFRISGARTRARLRAAYRSRVVTVITHPVFAWLAFAVFTYTWQFSRLTDDAAENVFVRDVQLLSLLAVSLTFWAPALCADPMRWRMAFPLRVLYVFVEMTHKALFGAMFLVLQRPLHSGFANGLPPWGPTPIHDQRYAIVILWLAGNIFFVFALIAILRDWVAYDRRHAHRVDWHLRLQREAAARHKAALDQVFRKQV